MNVFRPGLLISFLAFGLGFGAFFLGMISEGFRRTGDTSILWHSAPVALIVVLTTFIAIVGYAYKLSDLR